MSAAVATTRKIATDSVMLRVRRLCRMIPWK